MLISNDPEYQRQFPEKYKKWEMLDSIKLSDLVRKIIIQINIDYKTDERLFIPGLRLVLNHIAETEQL